MSDREKAIIETLREGNRELRAAMADDQKLEVMV